MSGLGEVDLYLAGEGRHERLYERLGAHCVDGGGVRFAVWAPNATAVSVVGDWNFWSEGADALRPVESSGIWEGVAANAVEGQRYKLAVTGVDGITRMKADPYAAYAEVPPENALGRLPEPLRLVGRCLARAAARGRSADRSRSRSTRCMPARGARVSRGASSLRSSSRTWPSSGSRTSS